MIPSDVTVQAPEGARAKALGAYYTDRAVSDFLATWALRHPQETALDPSFGGGVFLQAAAQRLRTLGGHPATQIFGVELDPLTHQTVLETLSSHDSFQPSQLLQRDFFEIPAGMLCVDSVIGNPPFIRYQRFKGSSRELAQRRALEQGVRITALASAWAPFVVHSVAMLKPHGRLGMVIPIELGYAVYARPVMAFLCQQFRRIVLLTFRQKLFPQLSEDTLLVLAEGRGEPFEGIFLHDLPDVSALEKLELTLSSLPPDAVKLSAESLSTGQSRLMDAWLPSAAAALYARLSARDDVRRLGALANIGIGYVTGDNDFFHPENEAIRQFGIESEALCPVVLRAKALRGLTLTRADWEAGLSKRETGQLLRIARDAVPGPGAQKYLAAGEAAGVSQRFKCRTRAPWYSVPNVYPPDALLTYMSGGSPRIVANQAGVFVPNTLHVLRLHADAGVTPVALAALWQTSLTRLSTELQGHAMGGGLLKLEPTEAQAVRIATPALAPAVLKALVDKLDALLRQGKAADAQRLADKVVLQQGLGLTESDCHVLAEGAQRLHARRTGLSPIPFT